MRDVTEITELKRIVGDIVFSEQSLLVDNHSNLIGGFLLALDWLMEDGPNKFVESLRVYHRKWVANGMPAHDPGPGLLKD